jgi:hypothetical protein
VSAMTTRRAIAVLLCVSAWPVGFGQAQSTETGAWTAALTTYAQDPRRNRRALLPLRREDPKALEPLHLLALGESSLRSRRYAAATRWFDQVIDREPGEPWTGWARIGLGWIALAQEDYAGARQQFALVADTSTAASAGLGRYVVALLDAVNDQPDAPAQFEAVAEDGALPPEIRRAARLARGYALYWQEDYAQAATVLDRVLTTVDVGTLWDDARYAGAWARLRAGDRPAAHAVLTSLANGPGRRQPVTNALVNLEPQAVMRAAFERYRRAPMGPPESHVAIMLDGNGYALAAAALRGFGRGDSRLPPEPLTYVRTRLHQRTDRGDGAPSRERPHRAPAAKRPAPAPAPSAPWARVVAGMSLLVLAASVWAWRATRRRAA